MAKHIRATCALPAGYMRSQVILPQNLKYFFLAHWRPIYLRKRANHRKANFSEKKILFSFLESAISRPIYENIQEHVVIQIGHLRRERLKNFTVTKEKKLSAW